MNDVWISCFREATNTLNFTTAAQNLHISQPSFSRNIAMLEEELGFKLFWRSKQSGIRLTPAGATFYNGLTEIEKRYQDLMDRSRRISRGEEGRLVIGFLNGFDLDSQTFYHIKKFQTQYPQVEVALRSCSLTDLENNLLKGVCDICFMMADLIKEKDVILFEKVYSIPTYFVVPKSAGFEHGKSYSMEELKDQTFLMSADYTEVNNGISQLCKKAGFEPKVKMAPDYETMMLWAEMGEGVTAVTLAQYVSNSPQVDVIKVDEMRNMDYSICWNKENYNPAIALFYSLIDEVKEVL